MTTLTPLTAQEVQQIEKQRKSPVMERALMTIHHLQDTMAGMVDTVQDMEQQRDEARQDAADAHDLLAAANDTVADLTAELETVRGRLLAATQDNKSLSDKCVKLAAQVRAAEREVRALQRQVDHDDEITPGHDHMAGAR